MKIIKILMLVCAFFIISSNNGMTQQDRVVPKPTNIAIHESSFVSETIIDIAKKQIEIINAKIIEVNNNTQLTIEEKQVVLADLKRSIQEKQDIIMRTAPRIKVEISPNPDKVREQIIYFMEQLNGLQETATKQQEVIANLNKELIVINENIDEINKAKAETGADNPAKTEEITQMDQSLNELNATKAKKQDKIVRVNKMLDTTKEYIAVRQALIQDKQTLLSKIKNSN
jgi:hypothetical protein